MDKASLKKVMKLEIKEVYPIESKEGNIYILKNINKMKKINRTKFLRLIELLLPEFWEKNIKDKKQEFNSYQTEDRLVYIDNESTHYHMSFK